MKLIIAKRVVDEILPFDIMNVSIHSYIPPSDVLSGLNVSVELLSATVFTVTLLSLVSTATPFLVHETLVVNPIVLKEHTSEREIPARRGLPGLSRSTRTVGTRTGDEKKRYKKWRCD